MSLSPYTGTWSSAEAAHLLRRTMFGATFQQIQWATSSGLDTVVSQLLTVPAVNPPVSYLPQENIVSFGQTWVNAVYPSVAGTQINDARRGSLYGWSMERCNNPVISIREKMCLFWNNHFAVEETYDARAVYNLHELYRSYCLGNFRELVKAVTTDVNMLYFLNGSNNDQQSPNENYSRELLELFTVGKGPQIAPGNYTNYTESDIAAGAKILSGWKITGLLSETLTSPIAYFSPSAHDLSDKQLSAAFSDMIIAENGAQEYADYIDVIFSAPNAGKHICRKLYRWFVHSEITDEIEQTVIAEMTALLEANDFVIYPVLEALLKSEHFYAGAFRGAMIRNPLEYTFLLLNATETAPQYDLTTNMEFYVRMYYFSSALGMQFYTPPNVGGWPAYYQAPSWYRLWAVPTRMKYRREFVEHLALEPGSLINGNYIRLNLLGYLNGLSDPSNAQQVVDDTVLVFCPNGMETARKNQLKSQLTNGLPDFEWTTEYTAYQSDLSNTTQCNLIRDRIAHLLITLFNFNEVHMM